MRRLFATATIAAMTLTGAAFAQTIAMSGADLNLRAGPGVQHPVSGVVPGGKEATVNGCIESANWCEVAYMDQTGWAFGNYLSVKIGEEFQPLYPNRQAIGVTVIEAPTEGASTQNPASGGALIADPLGAALGATAPGAAVSVPEPDAAVRTYIAANPQPSVALDGEVMVGAGVPESVTLHEVPNFPDYRYATINGWQVLVNPNDRKIVYVYR